MSETDAPQPTVPPPPGGTSGPKTPPNTVKIVAIVVSGVVVLAIVGVIAMAARSSTPKPTCADATPLQSHLTAATNDLGLVTNSFNMSSLNRAVDYLRAVALDLQEASGAASANPGIASLLSQASGYYSKVADDEATGQLDAGTADMNTASAAAQQAFSQAATWLNKGCTP
jgi:hypothetical protein